MQAAFCEYHLAKECVWKTSVLIPKGDGDFHIIVLVEVLWKKVTGIMNHRLAAAIQFGNTIHKFLLCRGTGATSLNANLLQQLMTMMEKVLYEILLYLHKAFNALDHDRCLGILEAYRVGLQSIRLLCQYWDLLTTAAQARGYYGAPFKVFYRVTQGDPISPTIFNVVVDVVLCHWVTMF